MQTIETSNVESFISLAKMMSATFILESNSSVEAVSTDFTVIRFNYNVPDTKMTQVQVDHNRHTWGFNGNIASLLLPSKIAVVQALQELGVSDKEVKQIKTIKASSLKEMMDTTPVSEKQEVSEILYRLTESSDTVKFKTTSSMVPVITLSLTRDTYMPYRMFGDVSRWIETTRQKMHDELKDIKFLAGHTVLTR